MKNKSRTAKKNQIDQKFILALTAFIVFTATYIGVSIFGYLTDIDNENNLLLTCVCVSTGGLISGFITGAKTKCKGLFYGAIYILPSLLLFTVLSLILNKFSFDYFLFINIFLSVIFAAIGGVISVNLRIKHKPSFKRK